MLNPRIVTIYGYASIFSMLVLLVLVWFKLVPESMYLPVFLIAAALFAIRIVLRIMLLRQERKAMKGLSDEK